MYVAANYGIEEAKQVLLFLMVVGSTIFTIPHDLFQLDKHTDKSYNELVKKLKTLQPDEAREWFSLPPCFFPTETSCE